MERDSAVYLLCCAVLCSFVTVTASVDTCMSCSYTFAGDGTRDRECVTDPGSIFFNVSCPGREGCYIITVYDPGYTKISSVVRGCNELSLTYPAPGQVECKDLGHRPRCTLVCQTDGCNIGDADIRPQGPSDDGNGVASLASKMALWLLTGVAVFVMSWL